MMRDIICFIFVCLLYSCGNSEGAFRSACRRDSLMKATDRNRKLVRAQQDIITEEHASNLPLCVRSCARSENCRSINYKASSSKSEKNCQILGIMKATLSAVLSNANGWVHYEQITQVGPRCRFIECEAGFQCNETCSTAQGYECVDIDECLSNPCRNGGTCNDGVNQYTCACLPGYTGTICQTDINECSSTPCKNGATCNDEVNKYTCTCVPGYRGSQCQTNIDECLSNPCRNGGTCNDGVNQYTCACLPGYTGTICQTDINECSSTPCKNGATCNNEVNKFTCTCVPGYRGSQCQININECSSSPCLNGGTCTDGVNSYSCTCTGTYGGTRCERRAFRSCKDLYEHGYGSDGVYTIEDLSGSSYTVYCNMVYGGWTLIARFSNADAKNWGSSSGNYWYDELATGSTTSPSTNADMISKAFYNVKGTKLKLTRSDDSHHNRLLVAANCLTGTFREKITSYGNFRSNNRWFSSNDGCRGSCSVTWYNAAGVAGFSQYACSGNLQSANYLSFWCHYSTGDGAVMMIGGGGDSCARADHGIAITESNSPIFDDGQARYDFGDNADKSQTTSYALNLWIR